MESKKVNMINRYKNILLVGIIFVLFITVGGFSVKFIELDRHEKKIASLERALMELKAAMNIDSVRQFNIQKIMKIIDQYNSNMPSSSKYEIADEVYLLSLKYSNLNVDLLCATISHESAKTWDPMITSKAGAMGLMQIMPITGLYLAAEENITWTSAEEVLYDPIYNLRLGASYLSTLVEMYGLEGGLAAYNGGEHRAALWLANDKADNILFQETKDYIPAILKLYQNYQQSSL
jgi:soluble lytic murein transglycosylase-like protein